jgi:Domain of Unknown Function (DUF1206)
VPTLTQAGHAGGRGLLITPLAISSGSPHHRTLLEDSSYSGLAAVAPGVEVGRRSVRLDFQERFTAAYMSRALATLTRALGGAGCAARAVVFVLTGFFIPKAAVLSSAEETKGLDAVFRSVASTAYGSWLLALLASGLLCCGLYCLLEARYRDLTPGR